MSPASAPPEPQASPFLPQTHTVLSALPEGSLADAVRAGLSAALGPATHAHHLHEERFAPCKGCFGCWLETPGACATRDAANQVMADIIGTEEAVWVTTPAFGCWDPDAKAALDRSIGLISPFFQTIAGETHHLRRYPSYPRMGVVAVDAGMSEAERARMRMLVRRNGLNLHAPATWVAFVPPHADAATVAERVWAARAQADMDPPQIAPFSPRTDARGVDAGASRARHVVVWVGSAKPKGSSASERLGEALAARLVAQGWTQEVVRASAAIKLHRVAAPHLLEAVERADLLVLAAPVYVDCLPALVLAGLGHLARGPLARRPALLPIVQAGFPELTHTALALEVLSDFADRVGMPWAGQLAMGGGGVLAGADLTQPRGAAWRQVQALEQAAAALHAGEPVPLTATEAFATPPIGPGAYRVMGQVGWLWQAAQHGTLLRLGATPFSTPAPTMPSRGRS